MVLGGLLMDADGIVLLRYIRKTVDVLKAQTLCDKPMGCQECAYLDEIDCDGKKNDDRTKLVFLGKYLLKQYGGYI